MTYVSSTIDAVRQRLADIEQGTMSGSTIVTTGITGIKHAYAHGNANIIMDIPVMINFEAGGAEYDSTDLGEDYVAETRQYPIRVYVIEKGQGIDGEAEARTEKFIEPIRDCFLGRPSLGLGIPGTGLPGVFRTKLTKDSGVSLMTYATQEYLGAEFILAVTQVIQRNYAPGE